MADFYQALAWIREGKPIRRKVWQPKKALYVKTNVRTGTAYVANIALNVGTIGELLLDQNEDWEIYSGDITCLV